MVIPARVLGREGTAPSERINIGFIGCGIMMNNYHFRELLRFGDVQAVAVCEVDQTRREAAQNRVNQA